MKNKKLFGILCGMLAAIAYGTNNLGAVNLYAQGMQTNSVLFYRFGLAWCIIAVVMLFRKESVKVTLKEFLTLSALGILFIFSSLSLYLSYRLMDTGVASTILFIYPVMTAAIMATFFKEKLRLSTAASIILSAAGVVMLWWSGSGGTATLSLWGVILVIISALSYAVYIIVMDKGKLEMSSFKINFYVLAWCAIGMLCYSLIIGQPIILPQTATSWFYMGWLAIVPAILALMLMVYAAKYVGSTTTAILGALEPLTAVVIGIFVFGEQTSIFLGIGIVLILGSVVIIALRPDNKQ